MKPPSPSKQDEIDTDDEIAAALATQGQGHQKVIQGQGHQNGQNTSPLSICTVASKGTKIKEEIPPKEEKEKKKEEMKMKKIKEEENTEIERIIRKDSESTNLHSLSDYTGKHMAKFIF